MDKDVKARHWRYNTDNFDGVIYGLVSTGPNTAKYATIARDVSHDNAPLLTAAQDLLAAAQMAHSALDNLMGDSDLPEDESDEMKAMQALSAAIAKATGES